VKQTAQIGRWRASETNSKHSCTHLFAYQFGRRAFSHGWLGGWKCLGGAFGDALAAALGAELQTRGGRSQAEAM